MIGSFWNLCRACPSMPVDKLHSEYRSTYRWHEYTGPRQEVVRRAPSTQPNVGANSDERPNEHQHTSRIDEESYNELPKLEPALPRRKKHPDLAYRHHEFLVSEGGHSGDQTDFIGNDRARSMERDVSHWRPSRRSKSEGPARTTRTTLAKGERRRDSDPDLENTGRDQGLLQKAISKISTEYRLQFAWPQGHTSRRDAADSTPRKSQSMNALRPPANSIIHKRRADFENKDASELEPLFNDNAIQEHETAKDFNTEYKKKFRPFSHYEYSEGTFKSKAGDRDAEDHEAKKALLDGPNKESWYKEVVELRKKAGEYKHRGWGSDLNSGKISDVYNQQVELWDQVSRRSSLSALSLASTTYKIYTKAEKDQENTKKSSPTKAQRNAENSARIVRDMIRHHLERTTGGTEYDGLILSPTRDKLEPTIPRKDDDSRGSQKNSPKKNSPQKLSLQKKTKSKSVPRTVRSQSVGPVDIITEKRSPKRQSRSATVKEKKTSSTTPSATRRPRPSSLNTTTASSRSKSRSVPPKIEDDRTAKSKPIKNLVSSQSHSQRPSTTTNGDKAEPVEIEKNEKIHQEKDDEVPPPEADIINLEPVVKSPPEPTRVKSPEQIIMRSPDPVNWTVPLDTGKTFTVTQNVREGDIGARPQSEVKAWTPPEVPPPIAQSAPPELPQQKEQARRGSNGRKTNETSQQVPSTSKVSPSETNPEERTRYCGKPIKGTSLRCLDDPSFESSSTAKAGNPIAESNVSHDQGVRSFASDVLEKARSRFDSFWRKNSTEEST